MNVTEPLEVDRPRPIAPSNRALSPDLARGCMLLFIALANSHYFLRGSTVLGGYPQDGSAVDSAVTWLIATFVDGRAFPMFGLLFGYGVARIVERQQSLGLTPKAVRHLLRRRSLVLMGVGFAHAVLLFVGDILGAYGVLLFAGAWLAWRRDRWLVVTAVLFFVLTALPSSDSMSISSDPPDITMLPPDLSTIFTERPVVSLFVSSLGPVGFVCPFVAGLLAGRRRVLEQPDRHPRLLALVAGLGITVAALGAQPVALLLAGVADRPSPSNLELIGPLHDASGVFGGFGYAALLALFAVRHRNLSPGPVVRALAATGQRSMTCYLSQSVVWTVAFTPFLLNLSGRLTVATTALLAVGTWLSTVVMADWMRRTGRRGPFETLIRRVTYRQPRAARRDRP